MIGPRRTIRASARWLISTALASLALYPAVSQQLRVRALEQRLDRVQSAPARLADFAVLDPALAARVRRLAPLLASWETIGGCGAGASSGAGSVKWVGRSTTGGLFQNVTQANYIPLADGYNLTLTSQVTRDLTDRWTVGLLLPFVHKRYNDYLGLPLDISNTGLGDMQLLGTYKFGPIRATSLTASLGLPTGSHAAVYRMDLLAQDKQLGPGRISASLTLDHTLDQTWGLLVVGGLASWRGGENELHNYRAPLASSYAYAGYFVGPFVPAFGLSFSGFLGPDREQGLAQHVPLLLLAANASLEWSNDWLAVLLGVSLPVGLYAAGAEQLDGGNTQQSPTGVQPWTAALGLSISPF